MAAVASYASVVGASVFLPFAEVAVAASTSLAVAASQPLKVAVASSWTVEVVACSLVVSLVV